MCCRKISGTQAAAEWFLRSDTSGSDDTNANGEQAILFIGDSIMQGSNNSSGPGPTPTAGTVKQYNHTADAIQDIGSADVYNVVSGGGTMIPQYGIDYNAESGYIPVAISMGSQGANFEAEAGDGGNNWSSTGTLRATAETRVTRTLELLGTTKLKAIFVVLGINSARGSEDLTTVVYPAIDDFFTWLTTTYPGVKIYVSQIGRHETQSHNDRIYGVRYRIRTNALNNTDVEMFFNMASWIMSSGYGADNLHPNQVGQNNMGASAARVMRADNANLTKWGRSAVAALYDNPSTTRRALIDTLMSTIVASGDYAKLELLILFKTTTQNNIWVDFAFLGYLFNNTSVIFTANDSIGSNGTSNHYAIAFVPSVNIGQASQNDFFMGVKCKVNSTAQGTLACLIGGSDGSDVAAVLQNTTPALTYRANDATVSTTTAELKFQDDAFYGPARNAGNKYLLKNATQLATAAVASTGTVSVLPTIGAFNNNGTIQNRINATYEYTLAGKYSDIALSSVLAAIETCTDNW